MAENLSFDVVALDKTAKALESVALRLDKLSAKLDRLGTKRVKVKVDVDTDGALAKFEQFTKGASKKLDDFSSKVASRSGLIGAAVVAGLAALPSAAEIAAGGVVLAFGAAFAGIGVAAAVQAKSVRRSFAGLKNDVVAQAEGISGPFVTALNQIAVIADATFRSFVPALRSAFKQMGPAVSGFAANLGAAFSKLTTAVAPLTAGFTRLLGALGDRLPGLFENISKALSRLGTVVAQNADQIAGLITWLLNAIPVALNFVGVLAKWAAAHQNLSKAMVGVAVAVAGFIAAVATVNIALKAVAAATGAATGALKAFRVVAFNVKVALALMGVSATAAKVALAGVGLVIGAAVAGLTFFIARQIKAKQAVDDLTQSIIADNGALGQNAKATVANALQQQGAFDAAHQLGVSVRDVTDAVLGNAAAQKRVQQAINTTGTQYLYLSKGQDGVSVRTKRLTSDGAKLQEVIAGENKVVAEAASKARDLETATGGVNQKQLDQAKKSVDQANQLGVVSDAFDSAKSAAQQYKDALDALNAAADTAEGTNIALHNQLAETRKELQHGTKTLKLNSAAGRKNRQAVLDLVTAAQAHANAMKNNGASIEKVNGFLRRQRSSLIAMVRPFFNSRAAAAAYIDKLLKIPKNVQTKADFDKKKANKRLKAWIRELNNTPHTVYTTAQVVLQNQNALNKHRATGRARGGLIRGMAAGGYAGLVRGPGTGTSDTAGVYALSNDEYVNKAAVVRRLGVGFFDALNNGKVPAVHVGSGSPSFDVRVFIGDRELTDIVDVRVARSDGQKKSRAMAGSGRVR